MRAATQAGQGPTGNESDREEGRHDEVALESQESQEGAPRGEGVSKGPRLLATRASLLPQGRKGRKTTAQMSSSSFEPSTSVIAPTCPYDVSVCSSGFPMVRKRLGRGKHRAAARTRQMWVQISALFLTRRVLWGAASPPRASLSTPPSDHDSNATFKFAERTQENVHEGPTTLQAGDLADPRYVRTWRAP